MAADTSTYLSPKSFDLSLPMANPSLLLHMTEHLHIVRTNIDQKLDESFVGFSFTLTYLPLQDPSKQLFLSI